VSREPVTVAALREGRANIAALVAHYPELTSHEAQARLAARLSTGSEVLTGETTADTSDCMSAPTPERRAVNLRLDPDLYATVNSAEAAIPALSRHAICLAALHIGLAALIDNPALVLEQNIRGRAATTKPAKKRSKK
jgi:hypothetical protein